RLDACCVPLTPLSTRSSLRERSLVPLKGAPSPTNRRSCYFDHDLRCTGKACMAANLWEIPAAKLPRQAMGGQNAGDRFAALKHWRGGRQGNQPVDEPLHY